MATRAGVKALVAACGVLDLECDAADAAKQAHAAARDAVLAFGHADRISQRCQAAVHAERAAWARPVEAVDAALVLKARCEVLHGMCLGAICAAAGRCPGASCAATEEV